ncbi:hypothetical protein FDP41_003166 [Naegleria fowleri]|uniref:Superoxide dismutase copper/zinc binding domain-containing protein n=1 Tax=Naegleria fowleri TaxID=5763 RepID=A0A6A5BUB4_NAEFO|nr:uncharacterized protein FDP41_003166 [Naegleria fowleri]KAF0977844.1 hypothetical protein FDP41_003166 [Naegleria fowleri]CAG4719697.1 unnamed protein product [Naegleria fowleri]
MSTKTTTTTTAITLSTCLFLNSAVLVILFFSTHYAAAATVYQGHCLLTGTINAPGLRGSVSLVYDENTNSTTISWSLNQTTVPINLQGKKLGFHIHEFGYLADAASTGSHYNPFGANHSLPTESAPSIHVGDLGNIDLSLGYSGVIVSNLVRLNGSMSVIGRAMRLHMQQDVGSSSQPSGNAGPAAAHCVIGIANVTSNGAMNDAYTTTNRAVATIFKTDDAGSYNVTGRVIFDDSVGNGNVRVTGRVCGLAPNTVHGFHVHQFGELNLKDGSSFMGHWNPSGSPHAYPGTVNRHAGDMGNITTDANGIATIDLTLDLLALKGVNSIIGRGVVIHQKPDDGVTQSTGGAAARYGIGVIGIPPTTPSALSLQDPNDACSGIALPIVIVTPPTTNSTKPKSSVNAAVALGGHDGALVLLLLISLIATSLVF